MKEIITSQNFIIYLVVINLIGYAIMFIDKHKAKKGSWRIPEKTIFMHSTAFDESIIPFSSQNFLKNSEPPRPTAIMVLLDVNIFFSPLWLM